MTAAEQRKLVAILGRLGSEHDGERAAAALLAHRMLHTAGLTWAQVMAPVSLPDPLAREGWRHVAARCLERTGSLRTWEVDFLRSLVGYPHPSAKQRFILHEIADRVLKGEPR